jgi:hypothetical protein
MKTIIQMAREADPKANLSEPYCLDHETRAWLERFAALVRADEREACAKVCDRYVDSSSDHEAGTAMNLQDAIRARGNT